MAQDRFTKADVEYLVDSSKYIKGMPSIPKNAAVGEFLLLKSDVYRKADGNARIPGLIVQAKVFNAPPGVPKPTPSAALVWHGLRIRGVDYELRHDNPDGSSVRGWHEHLWSPLYGDAYVIQARPEVVRKTLRDVLLWGLEKWNIEIIGGRQMEADYGD